jgi:hypothetical protein
MNDELLRLEALKLAVQTSSPNTHEASFLVRADEIFNYIKTGEYSIATVANQKD